MEETEIEDIVMKDVGVLGYPDADVLRRVKLAGKSGFIDLMVFPRGSMHRVVLIEAKRIESKEVPDKVVGQILRYYSHALLLGLEGLDSFRKYAQSKPGDSKSTKPISLKAIVGPDEGEIPWKVVRRGRQLKPQEIALFFAFSGKPSQVLQRTITMLHVYHGLTIGVIDVSEGKPSVLAGAALTRPLGDVSLLEDEYLDE